jgi:diaminopimelate epimerase
MKYEIYSGAGNDFVMLNNWTGIIPFDKQEKLTVKLCSEMFTEIDGVIFLDKPRHNDSVIRMNYFNRDGSFGAMCGNGARCIAMFAHKHGIAKNKFTLEAVDDLYNAEICDKINVKITFPEPKEIKTGIEIKADFGDGLKDMNVSYVNVGSDHIMVFLDDEKNKAALKNIPIEELDINHLGKILRFHNEFQPRGGNVNFVLPFSGNMIKLRTYERGVERETLACGTGIVSSGIISVLAGKSKVPVNVLVQSGETLRVDFINRNNIISNLSLTGSARKLSEGEIPESGLNDIL